MAEDTRYKFRVCRQLLAKAREYRLAGNSIGAAAYLEHAAKVRRSIYYWAAVAKSA